MRLAQRLILSFFAITLVLIAPGVYGVFALRDLRQVAVNLSTRDNVGALALGRLQTATTDLENSARIYLALARSASERAEAADRVTEASDRVERELEQLRRGGYPEPTDSARNVWARLEGALEVQHDLVEADSVTAADTHGETVINPAFAAMRESLNPIADALDYAGEQEVRLAQTIATRAATTTLLSAAIALIIALAIGAWTGRSLLRPVGELRRGMALVAEGDFEPNLTISTHRPDEIGDLARSFSLMTNDLAALDRLKAEFVSVASHELKTPLTVIRGYVSLLRDEVYGSVTPEQKKVLVSVGDQTDRLGRLIQQLLDISRFEAGVGRLDIREIDVQLFLDEFATSFEALAVQNEIDFKLEVDPKLPATIEGDSDRLNEVVGNLLSNAFKFTSRGGRITLRAKQARSNGSGVVIEVSDTGVGIPTDQLPRIFEKFYQVENEAQPKSVGTGLGLAISKEITEAHGGTISADSRVGKGTTFRVYLPAKPPTVESS